MIYIVPDLLEEILLRLPLKSILKFKSVSKQWRSILESRMFAERRVTVQKNNRKILAAGDHRTESRFEGDTEIEMFYLHCDDATRPSLTCDGLICIPVPGWVNVFNPSTGELLRFPSGPDPVSPGRFHWLVPPEFWWITFPGDWAMGFGRDKVNGSYKVVRMFFYTKQFDILDVNIGEWRKLHSPPPFSVESGRKSACVNGSIYWLELGLTFGLLALDLHTEEFRKVPPPPSAAWSAQLVNLDDRLAIARTRKKPYPYRIVEIWIIDAQEKTWNKTYNIPLCSRDLFPRLPALWVRPLTLSKQGNLFFHDNQKRLFKYYPETNEVHLIERDICVISPFVENLFPFRRSESRISDYHSGFQYPDHVPSSQISKTPNWRMFPNVFITTTLAASLVIFRYYCVSSRS